LTYIKAGFKPVGKTKSGLLAFQLLPEDMPPAERAAKDKKTKGVEHE
jgi:hypothetical protein